MLQQKRMVNRRLNRLTNTSLPAPVGGLNTESSYDEMKSNEAIVMDNFIPMASSVQLRKGYKEHARLPHAVKTLIPYKSMNGQDLFFCISGGTIYEISQNKDYSSYQEAYAEKLRALNPEEPFLQDEWQWAAFKDRLFLVNGVDTPLMYQPAETGETFGTFQEVNFTGENLSLNQLSNVFISKQRLWFIEKNSMRVWYTKNAGEVQGELIPFDMNAVASFGGTLVAGASWTQDGGAGMDDLTVFITSEGEVLVYKGIDPSNANEWTLKGVYKMASPLGKNCFLKYLGDLVLISSEGYIPLSKALPLEGANASLIAFSAKITNLVSERANLFGKKSGWQALLYPKGGLALFNVPLSRGYEQHVCNTTTGSWCRFTGINATVWALMGDRLYFADQDKVYLFDEGHLDATEPIHGRIEQAFTNFGTHNVKRLTLLNPHVKASRPFALKIYTNTDFSSARKSYQTIIKDIGESYWNKLKWKRLSEMDADNQPKSHWATLAGLRHTEWIANMATGVYFSLVLDTNAGGTGISFFSTGARFETGV